MMSPSMEERLRLLEDREAIRSLFAEYNRLLDTRDMIAYSRLFARDGEWSGRLGQARGPDAIRVMLEKNLPAVTPGQPADTFHLVVNESIEVEGDDATARSDYVGIARSDEDGLIIKSVGHYEDKLVRENGKWRFALRKVSSGMLDVSSARNEESRC